METNDKQSEILIKSKESVYQKLLKELIKSVEEFVTKKEIRCLSEALKQIFYHGLTLDNHVSYQL